MVPTRVVFGTCLVSILEECDDLVAETFCPPALAAELHDIAFGSQWVHFADDVGTANDVPESVR